jgi:hypothetical protein
MGLLHQVEVEMSGHATDDKGADYIQVKVSRASLLKAEVVQEVKHKWDK